ncbi:MAG: hypothetical protein ACPGR2_13670 [Psychrobium sp.]
MNKNILSIIKLNKEVITQDNAVVSLARVELQDDHYTWLKYYKKSIKSYSQEELECSLNECLEKIEEWTQAIITCRADYLKWCEKEDRYYKRLRKTYPYPKNLYYDNNRGMSENHKQYLKYWHYKYEITVKYIESITK